MERWVETPPYSLFAYDSEDIYNQICLTQYQMELIEQVSGVRDIIGYGGMEITCILGETEEIPGFLYVVDETQWEETFDFGKEREAFHNGELVLMCFPDKTEKEYILPKDDIRICAYDKEQKVLFISEPTLISIRWLSGNVKNRSLAIRKPYSVICSNAYLEKLLSIMKPGSKWGKYTAGKELGYARAFAYVDMNADDLSTDFVMAELCKKNEISFNNRRQECMANAQNYLQTLILLYVSGACVTLIILLIFYSTLSLEVEQEKKYFGIMRVIGMTSKQMWCRILEKALGRGIIATFSGWFFYIGYLAIRRMLAGDVFLKACFGAVTDIGRTLKYWDYSFYFILFLSLICLLVPLFFSLFAKRKLRKECWM